MLTDDEILELRRLYTLARESAYHTERYVMLDKIADLMVRNGFDGGDGVLPGILDEIARLRAENERLLGPPGRHLIDMARREDDDS